MIAGLVGATLVLRSLLLIDGPLRPFALFSLALGLDDLQLLGLVLLLCHPWNVARGRIATVAAGAATSRVHAMIGRWRILQ